LNLERRLRKNNPAEVFFSRRMTPTTAKVGGKGQGADGDSSREQMDFRGRGKDFSGEELTAGGRGQGVQMEPDPWGGLVLAGGKGVVTTRP